MARSPVHPSTVTVSTLLSSAQFVLSLLGAMAVLAVSSARDGGVGERVPAHVKLTIIIAVQDRDSMRY